ncbi:MAG: EAL domain-containing protein [Ketobacter sp.]|nr:MAG: EAL domain-containing protein [Ketobacter sp.]
MLKQRVMGIFWGLAGALLCLCNTAVAAAVVSLDEGVDQLAVTGEYLQLLDDPTDSLSIYQVTTNRNTDFTPVTSDIINLGHTASSVWATFSVQTSPSQEADLSLERASQAEPEHTWFLEVGYPLLKRVQIYVVQGGEVLQQYDLGYAHRMSARDVQNRFFVQPIRLAAGKEYQVYINVQRKNGSVQLPIKLYRPSAFLLNEIESNYVFGLFFGILLAMVVYNSYLFLSVGSRAYFYYILYIVSVGCAFLTTTGYGYLFVWGEFPLINEYSLQIPSTLAAITGLLFVRHFINVRQYYRYIDQFISLMVGVGWLLIAIKLLTPYFLSEVITAYVALISAAMPVMTFQCYRKGSRSAGFFLLGWGALLVGILLYTLSMLGWLSTNGVTTNAVLVGAAMETLLLSLGLADRINTERRAKYQALEAQHAATLQLKDTEHKLMHRALHSGITGLPNRIFLRSALDAAFNDAEEEFVLVLISLNSFHEINKTLGHSNGDAVLRKVTQRINRFCGDVEHIMMLEKHRDGVHYLAAIEGITFGFFVREDNVSRVQETVLDLLRQLEQPLAFQGLTLDIDASAGLACFPHHGRDCETLIRNAHIALEAASGRREKSALYSQEIDPYSERRISLIGELRNAIEQDQLQLYFQPQLQLGSGQVSGAEVLIRWIHPEYGFIPPDEFIPLAERTGVIHSLTYWICRKAFEFKRELATQGYPLNLSINISARNLQDPEFKRSICQMAEEQRVDLHDIIMELTETAIMTDPDEALTMMNALNEAGIRLSIDDFGTGYSSLSYLKKLPVDELKIDRSFVMEMASNSEDQLLVKTTLSMGHHLSMVVVAEGIEDEATLRILKDMGCDLAQGYHIARPMPGQDFLKWIAGRVTGGDQSYRGSMAGL